MTTAARYALTEAGRRALQAAPAAALLICCACGEPILESDERELMGGGEWAHPACARAFSAWCDAPSDSDAASIVQLILVLMDRAQEVGFCRARGIVDSDASHREAVALGALLAELGISEEALRARV